MILKLSYLKMYNNQGYDIKFDKYNPYNYLHIKEHDFMAFEEMTIEYLLDDKDVILEKENPDSVDIIVSSSKKITYKKIGEINFTQPGVYISTIELDNLPCFINNLRIIYYRLSDIYYMKSLAAITTNLLEKDRLMMNIYFYMYKISVRNNKLLKSKKKFQDV